MTTATAPTLPRRLSPLDAGFLYAERPTQPLHIGFCLLYAGQLSREALVRAVGARLHLLPRFRQRAIFPPFAVAHPSWEDDPAFDIENHIAELPLPPPVDDRVLAHVVGQVFAPPLDRNRPLWQMLVLRGGPDGSTAVVWKLHHAMVDGISAVELLQLLHDLQLDPPPLPPAPPWQPRPLPDPLTLFQEGAWDQWATTVQPASEPAPPEQRPVDSTDPLPGLLPPAPPTPFNAPVSGVRHVAWASFAFPEVRAIRAALGGTVNDLVLAVLAGGLGRYLQAHGYATDGVELRAGCPVSMREPEQRGTLGNVVTTLLVPLYVGIMDPVARLAAERAAMDQLKAAGLAASSYALAQRANQLPPFWLLLGAQTDVPNTLINAFATNVPGPQVPLYLAGHRLERMHLLGPLGANLGLFNAILSYQEQLTITATVDPLLMPDGWFYADCLTQAFAELRAAAVPPRAPAPGS